MKTILRVLGLLRPYRREVTFALVCILVGNTFALAVPRLLGATIDAVVARGNMGLVLALAGAIVVVSLLRGLFLFGQGYYTEAAAQGAAYRLRNQLYDHLQRLSFTYHDRQQTGELMSRATSDIENVRMFLKFGLERSVQLLFLLPLTCVLLLTLDAKLALLSFAFLPVILGRSFYASRQLRRLWDRVNADTGALTTILQENLVGVRVVRAFGREDFESRKFAAQARNVSLDTLEANKLHSFNMPFMNLMILLAIGLVLWLGGQEVIAGRMTPGALAQFIFYLLMLTGPVRVVGFIATLYSRAASSGGRIFEVLDAPSPVRDAPQA
ncbi:MAG: ABC transporter ATP-binding protein, partial [Chloroflexi bacterium]|nr:ABC transporter ATP-binding protein [Chloroflexota bacterium]